MNVLMKLSILVGLLECSVVSVVFTPLYFRVHIGMARYSCPSCLDARSCEVHRNLITRHTRQLALASGWFVCLFVFCNTAAQFALLCYFHRISSLAAKDIT